MNVPSFLRRMFDDMSEQGRARAYLDRSVSLVDLERRQREIDNGRFRERKYPF